MRAIIAAIAIPAALLAAMPALANAIEESDVEKGKVTLDADSGYIFLTAPGRFAGRFVRVPDDEDIATYRQLRADALVEAQEDHVRDMERWQSAVERAEHYGRDLPEEPIRATEESFAFPDIETFTDVDFGPAYVYSRDRDADAYSYLTQMKPGRYIWYGPMAWSQSQGNIGMCYCMGTVQFDVVAGAVTDLGNFLFAGPAFAEQAAAPIPKVQHDSGFSGYVIEIPGQVPEAELSYGLPETLAGWPAVTPEFHAAGKMNNTYGVMISRIAEIDGVIGYERDTVIDLRTGLPIETRTLD